MRRPAFAVPIVLLLSAAPATAQNADSTTGVRGIVTSVTGEPLPFADVRLHDGRWRVTADDQGRFQVLGVSPGTHRLQVRRLGYAPIDEEITLPAGRVKGFRLELEALPLQAPTVRVTARRNFGRTQRSVDARTLAESRDFSVADFVAQEFPFLLTDGQGRPFGAWPCTYLPYEGDFGSMDPDDRLYPGAFSTEGLLRCGFPSHIPSLQRMTEGPGDCATIVNDGCVPDWYRDMIAPADLEGLVVYRVADRWVVRMWTKPINRTD